MRDFRAAWKPLFLTDVAFKVLAVILLTPLAGVLIRAAIALSGRSVMSDLDILYFLLGPTGWICAVLVGTVSLGIVAAEQASLLGILCAKSAGEDLRPLAALRWVATRAGPVITLAVRIVASTFLAVAPFLAVAAAAYLALLTKYDINYYLDERPPEFRVALGIGGVLAAVLTVVLLRLFSGWFFALPLVLFEDIRPGRALQASAARARGRRRQVLCWLVAWALGMAALSALATGTVGLVGSLLIPGSTTSLRLLTVCVGVTLLLLFVLNLAVNLLATTTFAAGLFGLYREIGQDNFAGSALARLAAADTDGGRFRITRNRLLIAGTVGSFAALAAGGGLLQTVQLPDNVKIMAHRGSSKAAPENTMAAFQKAIEDGADWIELDVQETADGMVAVFHDSDFMRQGGRDLKIWDATVEDLEEIDIGSWFAPAFEDERVPGLAQVLGACKGRIRVNIELKYYGHDERLEQRVAEAVAACGMSSDVMAMSLKPAAVKKMKSLRPDWKVGLLMSVSAGNLNKIEADFLAVNARFANRKLIESAHKNGKEVYVWTVNDAATMSAMISRGVDGLLTDKPALARSVLRQRGELSTPERLLLELAILLGSTPEIAAQ